MARELLYSITPCNSGQATALSDESIFPERQVLSLVLAVLLREIGRAHV